MTRDANRAEAERWLGQAEDDLRLTRLALREGFFAQTCFLAQQVAEKAVKSMRYCRGEREVMGHSIRKLMDALRGEVAELDGLLEAAAELDLHYVPTRYPNGLPDLAPYQAYVEGQARRAVEAAEGFVALAARDVRQAG
jgi:HEPN domain-containing protein